MDLIINNLKVEGYAIFRESLANDKRFEIHGYYSEILDNETINEIEEKFN